MKVDEDHLVRNFSGRRDVGAAESGQRIGDSMLLAEIGDKRAFRNRSSTRYQAYDGGAEFAYAFARERRGGNGRVLCLNASVNASAVGSEVALVVCDKKRTVGE